MSYSYVTVGSSGADYDAMAETAHGVVHFAGEVCVCVGVCMCACTCLHAGDLCYNNPFIAMAHCQARRFCQSGDVQHPMASHDCIFTISADEHDGESPTLPTV